MWLRSSKFHKERVERLKGNATAQFAKLIKLHAGFDIKHKILKYSGLQFSVEEVTVALKKILK